MRVSGCKETFRFCEAILPALTASGDCTSPDAKAGLTSVVVLAGQFPFHGLFTWIAHLWNLRQQSVGAFAGWHLEPSCKKGFEKVDGLGFSGFETVDVSGLRI